MNPVLIPLLAVFLLIPACSRAAGYALNQPAVLYSVDKRGTDFQRGVNYRRFSSSGATNTPVDFSDNNGIATAGQFRGVSLFGGVVGPGSHPNGPEANVSALDTTRSYELNARSIGLPHGPPSGPVKYVLRTAQVGASTYSRNTSYNFGAVIPPPDTDVNGLPLLNTSAREYWFAEPFTLTAHTNAAYHWSPDAQEVFAASVGPVAVVWRKKIPDSTVSGILNTDYMEQSGLKYKLREVTYIVSGSASETPRRIYWTSGSHAKTGKPVSVPAGNVTAIRFAYNNIVPKSVNAATRYIDPLASSPLEGATDPDGKPLNSLEELRTIWYDSTQGQIHAYNREGRILVELLGEDLGDGRRRFLDTEIVDIYREVPPVDLQAELGEIITPKPGISVASHDLVASPLPSQEQGQTYLYGHPDPAGDAIHYYATRVTKHLNSVLVHWLEVGDQGLLWPKTYARYKLEWPSDESRYSHYVRPLVSDRDTARETGIQLPAKNAPVIAYQDGFLAPDGACAEITEDSKFNTWLDASRPVHRTLLRYNSRGLVAYERIYSWLNNSLKNSDSLVSTVATNLNGWNVPPASLSPGDIADSEGLAAYLKVTAPADSFGRFVKRHLSSDTLNALEQFIGSEYSDDVTFRNTLTADLNALLRAGGGGWTPRLYTNSWTCMATSGDGQTIMAGNLIPLLFISTNAGASWDVAALPFWVWKGLASSSDGKTLVAAAENGPIYVSTNSGGSWYARGSSQNWSSVACSSDGTKLLAAVNGGQLWTSGDTGNNWTSRENNRAWQAVASSGDGVKLLAVDRTYPSGTVYRSVDSGANWTASTDAVLNANDRWWTDVASSADGEVLVAANDGYNPGGHIYVSTNGGASWIKPGGSEMKLRWQSVAVSKSGQYMLAVERGFNEYGGVASGINLNQGRIFASTNYGSSWEAQLDVPAQQWIACAITDDGVLGFAGGLDGQVYSRDRFPGFHGGFQSDRHFLTKMLNGKLRHGQTLIGPENLRSPRLVTGVIDVGSRILPPEGNLAGYILQSEGNLFNGTAYKNPFTAGFETTAFGAIIPVNAVPTKNLFEVWWFRGSATDSVRNSTNGFENVYWPSIIGRYTSQWPTQPDEIVLASNAGSGALVGAQQTGTVYVQNDPTKVGYNPNEEHALMLGGRAYALRDDLNMTGSSATTYSSAPFVLLEYQAEDGRPAMRPFRVIREKPSAGVVFDYVVEAGKQLQAPMPLPLMAQPVLVLTNINLENGELTYQSHNYNTEPLRGGGDWPVNWQPDNPSAKPFAHYRKFTHKDRKEAFWVMRGRHAGRPTLEAGRYDVTRDIFEAEIPQAVAVVGQSFTNVIHASRRSDALLMTTTNALPKGLIINGTAVVGTPEPDSVGQYPLELVLTDTGDRVSVRVNMTISVVAAGGGGVQQGPLAIVSTNQYQRNNVSYVGRPPYLAEAANSTNSFTMQFYYKTQAGFAWPGIDVPPEIGSVVPYMRSAYSSAPLHTVGTPALDIVYRPVWPGNPPKMKFGQTLLTPADGLPAVRGQSSVKILYQQSIALDMSQARPSAVLFDPTSEKSFALKKDGQEGLKKVPAGIKVEMFQGKTFFPILPPHLVKRFFFDPARGADGSLVYSGEFVDELLGDDYLHLNVLRGRDLAAVKALCPASPSDEKTDWDSAIDSLIAIVPTKFENPKTPGQWITDFETASYIERANLGSAPSVAELPHTQQVGIQNLIELTESETAADSYALSAAGPGSGYITLVMGDSGNPDQTPPGEPVSLYVVRIEGGLYTGEVKIIPNENPLSELSTFQHSVDLGGRFEDYQYEWKIAPPVDGFPPAVDSTMSNYQPLTNIMKDLPRYTLGGGGIQGLIDNYIVLRYRPTNPDHPLYRENPTPSDWSNWTTPQLAEGWIKRVLAGINPFNQRVTDLYNNSINTDANILTSAGRRYEGDVALNLASINNYGLIEIYETVMKRGKSLSIDAGVPINFGPANDALLLAAGYLSDLYTLVGNEAFADAVNPTIGIGTADNTYGDVATSLFSFGGQLPSLLEEELALLRGRDDFAQPGVTTPPLYNRLVWNFTRGINSGEVIYALNYNILDQNNDGKVDAVDAIHLYPQGHGDAYGHYLTAIKGYYTLLMNPNFDWVPRVEAVTVLGKPVTVDYLDERKFASCAVNLARAGRGIFDLTWRKDFIPGLDGGWEHFGTNRVGKRTVLQGNVSTNVVREWGADQWASRIAQGSLYNWVIGNAIIPEKDTNPSHEGIQVVDRTTVLELGQIVSESTDLQLAMDNAEGRQTPLGMPQGAIAFDINPAVISGSNGKSHFEQVYERAKVALRNAVVSFDDAKSVTRLMRSEQDSLEDLQTAIDGQERAFTNSLIELYGTPYTDDVGTGKFYPQGYSGPDLFHFIYTDDAQLDYPGLFTNASQQDFKIDIQDYDANYEAGEKKTFGFVVKALRNNPDYTLNKDFISYTVDSSGAFIKPASWKGRRVSPGKIQAAIGEMQNARAAVLEALAQNGSLKRKLDRAVEFFGARVAADTQLQELAEGERDRTIAYESALFAAEAAYRLYKRTERAQEKALETTLKSVPGVMIAGMSNGGDLAGPAARGSILAAHAIASEALGAFSTAKQIAIGAGNLTKKITGILKEVDVVKPLLKKLEHQQAVLELDNALSDLQSTLYTINQRLQELDNARKVYYSLVAEGERLQLERQVARKRSAAIIQGYRTRDAAFRIFRNEKLERYKTLFDLAARYAYLAANAYDYETGLLNTDAGKSFVNRIVNARALGVVANGEPQYAGSNSGDPGLSSVLAEMAADWGVIKGRLGFNNPDAYGTTVSLRHEKYRLNPNADGREKWQQILHDSRTDDLLADADVRRHCLQLGQGDGLAVPGLVIPFETTTTSGKNLFGLDLSAGDSAFHPSSFATKIFAVGVALEGYRGMSDPTATTSTVGSTGVVSPADPSTTFLDPQGLAATPYVYLIPVGADAMRSPPLGDGSNIRVWTVHDVAIPLPFNIGASEFSTKKIYRSADSLTEPLFGIRKHQAFRPVSTVSAFGTDIYGTGGSLDFSQYTNNRLIGRSAWNTKWKLVIPGNWLLSDSKEGLDRFIQTVTDIKLHFVTYSHAGN